MTLHMASAPRRAPSHTPHGGCVPPSLMCLRPRGGKAPRSRVGVHVSRLRFCVSSIWGDTAGLEAVLGLRGRGEATRGRAAAREFFQVPFSSSAENFRKKYDKV